jgi:hypothetical protein
VCLISSLTPALIEQHLFGSGDKAGGDSVLPDREQFSVITITHE